MKADNKVVLFWFRRDLRLEDNHGLYRALSSGLPVIIIFIFDTDILDHLEDKQDKRVSFIWKSLVAMNQKLLNYNCQIQIYYGKPKDVFKKLTSNFNLDTVFANEDYEPYGIERDLIIKDYLSKKKISFSQTKDHVIFHPSTILKDDGKPYTVYTPFKNKWREKYNKTSIDLYPSENFLHKLESTKESEIIHLDQIGFKEFNIDFPDLKVSDELVENYANTRDYPALSNGTSKLGIHLRFGTISIRALVRQSESAEIFLNELIWREFFIQILFHFPMVVNRAFKIQYDNIEWENNEAYFKKWCAGETGYPMVDAGMKELNSTGYMHNRVRMVVASFLCKHLLIDWRWGEAYFAEKLLDYELASNNGNWQWAAGTGCDAAPYFRIFNPTTQMEKFDPEKKYIKKWLGSNPENFAPPIVNHTQAREKALKVYKQGLNSLNL